MPISNKVADGLDEVDVIICGGGTAACVVGGRLAEADPNLSVLVIEGGENNDGNPNVHHPALFLNNLAPNSKTAAFYQGKKSDALAGREVVVPTGGTLGGGSSINFMLYSRAQGCDFDSWKAPGWSTEEMLPFMKKLETYHGSGTSVSHGSSGPVQISDGGFRGVRAQEDFMSAATNLGYKDYADLEDPTQVNDGFERALRYVTPDGVRADAAHAYLHPLLNDGKHPNLHVLCESKVVRILFDEDKRAVGVEYTPNPQYQIQTPATQSPVLTVKARKLVVSSAGAIGTPLILQRSGIGSREILEKASVPVISDLQVGSQYDDHTLIVYPFTTNLAMEETADAFLRGKVPMEVAEKLGVLGWNAIDIHFKLRPTEEEIAEFPDLREAWERDYKNVPNRPFMLGAGGAVFIGDMSTVPEGQYFTVAVYSAYSYSRGHLHITGPNLGDEIDFEPGYLTDKDDIDLKMHIWAYKKLRKVMRSTKMYTGEYQGAQPLFPEGSQAACASNTDRDSVIIDPKYTAEDDKAIEKFLRENIGTTWHSLGTARMAPKEQNGVVDSLLNVYGVQGLKCVDLSIAPFMTGNNTNNTAYCVGEKGADIILQELGLVNALRN